MEINLPIVPENLSDGIGVHKEGLLNESLIRGMAGAEAPLEPEMLQTKLQKIEF